MDRANRSIKLYREEISGVPLAINQLCREILNNIKASYKEIKEAYLKCSSVMFFGMASSQWASWPTAHELRSLNKKVSWMTAYDGIFIENDSFFDNSLIFLVSQSGETIEIKELLRRIRNKPLNTTIVAITNNINSTLARQAHIVVDINAGIENHAPTKTYVNSIICLFSLLIFMEYNPDAIKGYLKLISSISEYISDYYKICEEWADKASGLWSKSNASIQFLALGPQLGSAKQASMLCSETAKVFSSVQDWATFRHGFETQVDSSFFSIGYESYIKENNIWVTACNSIIKRGGQVLLIPRFPVDFNENMHGIPISPDSLVSIWGTLPIHYLCIALANRKNIDASQIERKVTLDLVD